MRDIPKDHPVQPISPDHPNAATCGTCGLSWDDVTSTSMTPTPSGRCPFEAFHTRDMYLDTWYVVTFIPPMSEGPLFLVRTYQAEEADHAIEQSMDAFPDEQTVCASVSEPMFYGSVKC